MNGSDSDASWIISGLVACAVYPLAVLVPMPARRLTSVLGSSFDPALAIASLGFWHILRERRVSAAADIAVMANALARLWLPR